MSVRWNLWGALIITVSVIFLGSGLLLAVGSGSVTADSDVENKTNVTPPHVHPVELERSGDLDALQKWLGGFMGERLAESAFELEDDEFQLAKDLLGDEYVQRLIDYRDVDDLTGLEGVGDAFEDARESQERLADQLQAFEETHDAYHEAVGEGDGEAARAHARELQSLADEIDESAADVLAQYEEIDEDYFEMGEAIEAIEIVRDEALEDAAAVEEAQFVGTELSVEVADNRISFHAPLEARGEITRADGTPIERTDGTIDLGERNISVRSDDEGRFDFTYRPVWVIAGEIDLDMTFVPDPATPYLQSNETVPVEIEQVDASLTLTDVPDTVAYGDEAPFAGTMAAEGVGIDDAPVSVTFGGKPLGNVTVENGEFGDSFRVPAEIEDGDRTIRVAPPGDNRAVTARPAERTVVVTPTATELGVNVDREGDVLTLSGSLLTTDRDPVEGQEVDVTIAGEDAGSIETNEDGTFEAVLAVPDTVEPGLVEVAVGFDGTGLNLDSTAADVLIFLPESALRSDGGETIAGVGSAAGFLDQLDAWLHGVLGPPPWGDSWIQLILIGLVTGLGALMVFRLWVWKAIRSRLRVDSTQDNDAGHDPEWLRQFANASMEVDSTDDRTLVQIANDRLEKGSIDDAVVLGYAAIRSACGDGSDGSLTHGEFLERQRMQNGASPTDDLAFVTDCFERVVFADADLSAEAADGYLQRVRDVCEETHADTVGATDRSPDGLE